MVQNGKSTLGLKKTSSAAQAYNTIVHNGTIQNEAVDDKFSGYITRATTDDNDKRPIGSNSQHGRSLLAGLSTHLNSYKTNEETILATVAAVDALNDLKKYNTQVGGTYLNNKQLRNIDAYIARKAKKVTQLKGGSSSSHTISTGESIDDVVANASANAEANVTVSVDVTVDASANAEADAGYKPPVKKAEKRPRPRKKKAAATQKPKTPEAENQTPDSAYQTTTPKVAASSAAKPTPDGGCLSYWNQTLPMTNGEPVMGGQGIMTPAVSDGGSASIDDFVGDDMPGAQQAEPKKKRSKVFGYIAAAAAAIAIAFGSYQLGKSDGIQESRSTSKIAYVNTTLDEKFNEADENADAAEARLLDKFKSADQRADASNDTIEDQNSGSVPNNDASNTNDQAQANPLVAETCIGPAVLPTTRPVETLIKPDPEVTTTEVGVEPSPSYEVTNSFDEKFNPYASETTSNQEKTVEASTTTGPQLELETIVQTTANNISPSTGKIPLKATPAPAIAGETSRVNNDYVVHSPENTAQPAPLIRADISEGGLRLDDEARAQVRANGHDPEASVEELKAESAESKGTNAITFVPISGKIFRLPKDLALNHAEQVLKTEAKTTGNTIESYAGDMTHDDVLAASDNPITIKNDAGVENTFLVPGSLQRAHFPDGLNVADARKHAKDTGYDVIAREKVRLAKLRGNVTEPVITMSGRHHLPDDELRKSLKDRLNAESKIEGRNPVDFKGSTLIDYTAVSKPLMEPGSSERDNDYERVTATTLKQAKEKAKEDAKKKAKDKQSNNGSSNGSTNMNTGSSTPPGLEGIVGDAMGQDDFNVDPEKTDYQANLSALGIDGETAKALFTFAFNKHIVDMGDIYHAQMDIQEDSDVVNAQNMQKTYSMNGGLEMSLDAIGKELGHLVQKIESQGVQVKTTGQEFGKVVEDYLSNDVELVAYMEEVAEKQNMSLEDVRQKFHELGVSFASEREEYNVASRLLQQLHEGIIKSTDLKNVFGTDKNLKKFFKEAKK